jgi:oligopeptide transport system substrate-binding protein
LLRRGLITLGLVVLAACGGNEPGEQAGVQAGRLIGGASGSQLAEVQVLHKGNGAEPQTLDPHKAEGVPSSNVLRDLFEGLTSEARDGSVIPGAALSWQVSGDGLVWTFDMRRDASWSNGDPVTAHDFEYGIKRSVDPVTLSRYSSVLFPILNAEAIVGGQKPAAELGVRALDEFTLEITLNAPTPYLLELLNHSTTYPVHGASVELHGDRFARPGNLVSNGAYKLQDWVVQSHIHLVRNENYYGNADTVIDEVFYYAIENNDAELKRYRADELDFTYTLPYKQLTWIRENLAQDLEISPYLGMYYFGYNVTRPPFEGSLELRKALSLAIDRDIITQRVTGAGEISAYGFVPPVNNYTGQQPEWAGWTQEQRNAEAVRLFEAAGYSGDQPLKVRLMYNTDENHKRVSVAIASMWKQVLGVETSLENQEWKVFLETRKQKAITQVFRAGWIGDYNDPYTFLQMLHSKNEQNDQGWNSPEFDALLDAAAQESDTAKRRALMEQAERFMLEDAPVIPVYFYVNKRVVKPWVGGYQSNIMDHLYTKNMRILKH